MASHTIQSDCMYYVYVIESESTGEWYIGYSADLKERVAKHNRNGNAATSRRGSYLEKKPQHLTNSHDNV